MLAKFLILATVLLVATANPFGFSILQRAREIVEELRASEIELAVEPVDVELFVRGFVTGIGAAEAFKDIKPCIKVDQKTFANLVQAAIYLNSKKPEEFKKGLKALGGVTSIIPAACTSCGTQKIDLELMTKMIQTFSNPHSFLLVAGRNILINHVEVYNEITALKAAYEDKSYERVGYWTGKTMAAVVEGEKNKIMPLPSTVADNEGWNLFVSGFIKGLTPEPLFDALKKCLTQDPKFYNGIGEGFTLMKTRIRGNVLRGIRMIGRSLEPVPVAANDCKVSEDIVRQLVKYINYYRKPESFSYIPTKSLMINKVQVYNVTNNSVGAWDAKKANDSGFWTGRTMASVSAGREILSDEAELMWE